MRRGTLRRTLTRTSSLDEGVGAEADLDMDKGTDIVPVLRAKRHLALMHDDVRTDVVVLALRIVSIIRTIRPF